jgi:hypothetical protein
MDDPAFKLGLSSYSSPALIDGVTRHWALAEGAASIVTPIAIVEIVSAQITVRDSEQNREGIDLVPEVWQLMDSLSNFNVITAGQALMPTVAGKQDQPCHTALDMYRSCCKKMV